MKQVDFTIVQRPAYITFTCPHCGQDQRMDWGRSDRTRILGRRMGNRELP